MCNSLQMSSVPIVLIVEQSLGWKAPLWESNDIRWHEIGTPSRLLLSWIMPAT